MLGSEQMEDTHTHAQPDSAGPPAVARLSRHGSAELPLGATKEQELGAPFPFMVPMRIQSWRSRLPIKWLFILCACLTALSGCRTPDYTKGQSNICQVHGVPMDKRTVPIAYGMIPMNRAEAEQGEWQRRTKHYPNPGDCLPATSINVRGEKYAKAFVCRQCAAAFRAAMGVDAEAVARAESELARLRGRAARETGWPPPSAEESFRLLSDLAARGRLVELQEESEARMFDVERRGGSRGKLFEIGSDARIAMVDTWIQDKAGPYLLKSATLYVRRGVGWMKAGQGLTTGAAEAKR
jgi:hypothetical protein